ncbi:MAG TPA: SLC13 family permease, partial [Candidatus Methanomethylicus sp.]|nr:SLC13 family permease [Candidatus Methanomethylicus sp.]
MEWGAVQLEALAIFALVYALIVLRRVGRHRVEVWMAMLIGAMLFLGMGLMSLDDAVAAINSNVMLFLVGMFLVVEVMVQTGLLQFLAVKFIRAAKGPSRMLLLVIVFVGVASAFLVNDAVVLVMTPIVIAACPLVGARKVPYLIAVALSSNIGSALTPIGNPQNVLIKIESGIGTLGFMGRMAVPVA